MVCLRKRGRALMVDCPQKPGVQCDYLKIVALSEASGCVGCPFVYPCDHDELLASRTTSVDPHTNPLVAGRMGPVTATRGGFY